MVICDWSHCYNSGDGLDVDAGSFQAAHQDLRKAHQRYKSNCRKRGVDPAVAAQISKDSSAVKTAQLVSAIGAPDATTAAVKQAQAHSEAVAQKVGAVVSALAKSLDEGVGERIERDLVEAALALATSAVQEAALAKAAVGIVAGVGSPGGDGANVAVGSQALLKDRQATTSLRSSVDDDGVVGCVPSIGGNNAGPGSRNATSVSNGSLASAQHTDAGTTPVSDLPP